MGTFELSPSQGMALAVLVLHKDDAPSVLDIETELGFSESMAQKILSELEQKGYLIQDRTSRTVTLTDKALAASEAAHERATETP